MSDRGQSKDTKLRLLDAAERLFAEHGFDGASLRQIIAAAQVNLASSHYHFGSKEALLDAVIARRLEPINRERLAMLEALLGSGGGPIPMERLLEAILLPPLRLLKTPEGAVFARLMGRMHAEGGSRLAECFRTHMADVLQRFVAAMAQALPGLPKTELFWRIHFAMGAMAHTFRGARELEVVSGGAIRGDDLEGAIRRLVSFLAAGFRAPIDLRSSQDPHHAT